MSNTHGQVNELYRSRCRDMARYILQLFLPSEHTFISFNKLYKIDAMYRNIQT